MVSYAMGAIGAGALWVAFAATVGAIVLLIAGHLKAGKPVGKGAAKAGASKDAASLRVGRICVFVAMFALLLACGIIVEFGGKRIYYAGDTGVFSDMKLLSRFGPIDCAILPIGDNFTMGMEDAALAASWIAPRFVIPVHYKTWPVIDSDPETYKITTESHYHVPVQIVAPGTTYEW